MIKVTGSLAIRQIEGRNGVFSVGKLQTELGEFSVKDAMLEQYDEGKYEGEFGISRIYPAHYLAGNRLVVEVRAIVETMALAGIDALETLPDDNAEPDPIEESRATAVTADVPTDREAVAGGNDADQAGVDQPDADLDQALFGELWPIEDRVKLDPTVDRGLFRRQKDRLKAMGYRFQPLGQHWELPAAADHQAA